VERSSQEQARGGKQVTHAIESISTMVNQINMAQRERAAESDQLSATAARAKQLTRDFERQMRSLAMASERLHNIAAGSN
jgi:methyl-accepting chemotaxis protein